MKARSTALASCWRWARWWPKASWCAVGAGRGTFPPAAFGSHRPPHWRGVHTTAAAGTNLTAARCGKFLVYDSPLSEYAAVGFEYGLHRAGRRGAWEAQFGDFVTRRSRSSTSSIAPVRPSSQLSNVAVTARARGRDPTATSARIERFLEVVGGDHRDAVDLSNYFTCRRHALTASNAR